MNSSPKATVRQTWSPEPLTTRATVLKVRAFDEWFSRGSLLSPLQLAGEIRGGQFVVSISRLAPIILSGNVLHDSLGPYAHLECQQHALGHGLALRVEVDAHDDLVDMPSISCFELPRDIVAQAEVCNATRWYSVYFNPLGQSDGTGMGGPRGRNSAPPCA